MKAVLQNKGKSQTWLAEQLGFTFTTVNGWCNNRSQPHLEELIKIAEILDVAPADLITNGTKRKGQIKVSDHS